MVKCRYRVVVTYAGCVVWKEDGEPTSIKYAAEYAAVTLNDYLRSQPGGTQQIATVRDEPLGFIYDQCPTEPTPNEYHRHNCYHCDNGYSCLAPECKAPPFFVCGDCKAEHEFLPREF